MVTIVLILMFIGVFYWVHHTKVDVLAAHKKLDLLLRTTGASIENIELPVSTKNEIVKKLANGQRQKAIKILQNDLSVTAVEAEKILSVQIESKS